MTVPRLFVEADLAPGAQITLSDAQARYLSSVLRLAEGDGVRVFNGRDGEWRAVIEYAGKRSVALRTDAQTRSQALPPDILSLFSPVKRHGTDLIVEKATEMGVRTLRPVRARRTIAENVRVDRLRLIAIEAAEQTERLDVPDILPPLDLFRALDGWDPGRVLFFADEAGDAPPIAHAAAQVTASAPIALLTGPEGGFESHERDALRDLPFVRPVSLGPRILRAETAVIAALAVLQSVWGDWRGG